MSLPVPTTSKAPTALDPRQLQALDAPLIALTQQCGGDLRQLMFAYFSFLNRRTDFYLVPHPNDVQAGKPASMGFKEGDAEKLLVAAFRQFPLRRIPKGGAGAKTTAAAAPTKQATSSSSSKKPAATTSSAKSKTTTAPTPSGHKKETAAETKKPETKSDADKKDTTATSEKKLTQTKTTNDSSDSDSDSDDDDDNHNNNMAGVKRNEENGLQIPVGNGGSAKHHKWTQTIDECSVLIGVPKNFRGRDLDISITPSSLSVKSKKALPNEDSPRTFVQGKLTEKVRPDESTWSVEGGVVIVILDKIKKTFWSAILEGDDPIDTELVDNRRHISEYDDVTQAQFRKIIFDQGQYHKGLPTSDELLGEVSSKEIPPLPPGVEFIDKKKLDEEDKKNKAAAKK